MDEVDELFRCLAAGFVSLGETEILTYGEAFQRELALDPHGAGLPTLRQCAAHLLGDALPDLGEDRDAWLDLLMSHGVQPGLGQGRLTFVHAYPASQAALARIRPGAPPVAERFELFFSGLELANGFHELSQAEEQRARFEREQILRRERSLEDMPLDEHLLVALQHGLPDCAGVAMGLDRVLLLLLGGSSLSEILNFPIDRA
jgi:lysyl-tRNA synthetase class 2